MDYKQILDDILELNKQYVVISGFGDIITLDYGNSTDRYFKEFTEDNYYVIMGKYNDDMIIESMRESHSVDRDGEYSFDALLKYVPGDYDEYGRSTMRDCLEIVWIEWSFNQTFEQRDRQYKLDNLFDF